MPIKLPVIVVTTTNLAALILQAPLGDIAGPIERLSLVGAQGVAIYFLWRALSRKDEELGRALAAKDAIIAKKDAEYTAMAVKVTETMTSVLEGLREQRTSVERIGDEIGNAIDNLASNLGALPCTAEHVERAERADHQRLRGGVKK